MNKEGEFDWVCIFFMVFCAMNLTTSIVAFCIDAGSGIGFAAVLNLLLPSVILGRKKPITPTGQHKNKETVSQLLNQLDKLEEEVTK